MCIYVHLSVCVQSMCITERKWMVKLATIISHLSVYIQFYTDTI